MDRDNKKEQEYKFIQEQILCRKKNKIKKMFLSIIWTVFLGCIFGLTAGVVLRVTGTPIDSMFSKGKEKSHIEFPSSDTEDDNNGKQQPGNSDGDQGQTPNTSDTEETREPDVEEEPETVIIKESVKADIDDFVTIYSDIRAVANEVSNSMVLVTSTANREDWFHDEVEVEKQTIGLIVGNNNVDLLILVSYAQVKDGKNINVTFNSDIEANASLLSFDEEIDFSIITVPLSDLPKELQDLEPATLGESSYLPVGTPIIALGSPNGYLNSMEIGMINNKGTSAYIIDHEIDLFHTNINYVEDGEGFIVNLEGEIIGIISTKLKDDQNKKVSTSISISSVKKIIESLVNNVDRAYFGITATDITKKVLEESGLSNGIAISEVIANSPAFHAGLQKGDVIISMDSNTVISVKNFQNRLTTSKPEEVVTVELQRTKNNAKEIIELDIILGNREF